MHAFMVDTQKVQRGATLNMSQMGLTNVAAELGWDASGFGLGPGVSADLDVVGVATPAHQHYVASQDEVAFYNHKNAFNGAMWLTEDDRTGSGNPEDPDEILYVNLAQMPAHVGRVGLGVYIQQHTAFNAQNPYYNQYNGQMTFGRVQNAWLRLRNTLTGQIVAWSDLDAQAATAWGVTFGEFYRQGNTWEYRAVGLAPMSGQPEAGAFINALARPAHQIDSGLFVQKY